MSHINIGTGKDISIAELAKIIARVVEYEGGVEYNGDYPDGTKQKLLDVSLLSRLGWNARIGIEEGISSTYKWYLDSLS